MPLPEQILESVQHDVDVYSDYLRKVALGIISQKISDYPIFVAHREPFINIGRPIIVAERMQTDWSFNASFLEEFISKSLIEARKVAQFKKSTKAQQSMFVYSLCRAKRMQVLCFVPIEFRQAGMNVS